MRLGEKLDIFVRRAYVSEGYKLLCCSFVAAGVLECTWLICSGGELPLHPLFVLLEGYVTVGLLAEVLLRAALERRQFWRRAENLIDLSVSVLSVLTALLGAFGKETPAEMLMAEFIITARIVYRLVRLVSVSKQLRRHHKAHQLEVRFDSDTGCTGELVDGLTLDWPSRDVESDAWAGAEEGEQLASCCYHHDCTPSVTEEGRGSGARHGQRSSCRSYAL
jgi:hypothetical protein